MLFFGCSLGGFERLRVWVEHLSLSRNFHSFKEALEVSAQSSRDWLEDNLRQNLHWSFGCSCLLSSLLIVLRLVHHLGSSLLRLLRLGFLSHFFLWLNGLCFGLLFYVGVVNLSRHLFCEHSENLG